MICTFLQESVKGFKDLYKPKDLYKATRICTIIPGSIQDPKDMYIKLVQDNPLCDQEIQEWRQNQAPETRKQGEEVG